MRCGVKIICKIRRRPILADISYTTSIYHIHSVSQPVWLTGGHNICLKVFLSLSYNFDNNLAPM